MCQSEGMDPLNLRWPLGAPVLPVAPMRPVIDRLGSLARTHEKDARFLPGRAAEDDEGTVSGDPPPVLEQIVDEIAGFEVRGQSGLILLVGERTDVGPYTLLGGPTTFYPLHEGDDAAVVLTLDGDGAAGAVYGIGEDLALRLAAPDLASYMERYADAVEATLAELDARVLELHGEDHLEDEAIRTEVASALMDQHLFAQLLGTDPEESVEHRPLLDPSDPGLRHAELPEGTVAAADLRGVALGTAVDVIDAHIDGDPLEHHLDWRSGGLVVALVPDAG